MLDLKRVTLFTLYVPWDKSKIASEDAQDGEIEKKLDNGLEETIKAIHTCLNFAEFGDVKFVTSKQVIEERGEELQLHFMSLDVRYGLTEDTPSITF